MNKFNQKLKEAGHSEVRSEDISILCVLIGNKCNLRCGHCYLESSPESTEEMSLTTINKLLKVLRDNDQIRTVELTGGEPMLNPHFKYFVQSAADMGKKVMVASNLTLCSELEMEDVIHFLAENRVKIYASLPSWSEEDVDRQRGKGTYRKVIDVLKRLNEIGYGRQGSALELDLEFNPSKAAIAPDREILEKIYKERLKGMHGITFNNLIALTNAPLGRLKKSMSGDKYNAYFKELEDAFNHATVENMMCRHMLTVCHDEKFYDCGFLYKLDIPVKSDHSSIDKFDYDILSKREIATNPLCFICTAGGGLNCFPNGINTEFN